MVGFNPVAEWGVLVQSSAVSVWVSSGCSGFHPQPKHMQVIECYSQNPKQSVSEVKFTFTGFLYVS